MTMGNDVGRQVLVTGATGYLGRALVRALLARGHVVRALARASSLGRVAVGAEALPGDALNPDDVARALAPGTALVHLVGTPHPSPAKAAEFVAVDLASIRASVAAAQRFAGVHLVYVSVAQPAPVMRAYVDARARGEAAIADAALTATILRPWYVIGPGHRWPVVLSPLAWLAERFPPTRATARRLGFVTLDEMVGALVSAVENPPARGERRVIEVPAIRESIASA